MLKKAVEMLRPEEIGNLCKLQAGQLYREVVLRSKHEEQLPSNIHLER